ncbi:hypothetical protein GUJ93_ZPchr0008g13826 [Zizania palustris]|uniref:Uncharacterized protein n=1 Tax=Zizania palustris TaxID=103762 RepID=A0A8J5RKB0_ZIZPA|nr:hypothetical protein GUJ93_ZPchr0008g13826 [Zizania palustris]
MVEMEGLTMSSSSATRTAGFPGAAPPTSVDGPTLSAASTIAAETEGAGVGLCGIGTRTRWRGTWSSRRACVGHSQGALREPPSFPPLDAADSDPPSTRAQRRRRLACQTPPILAHAELA